MQVLGAQRPTDQVALAFVAAGFPQHLELHRRLDALGGDRQTERTRQRDHRIGDGEAAVTDRTVDVHVRNLRSKIKPYDRFIETVRGAIGPEGMKFFPYVFTLFIYILLANLLGLFPSIPGVSHTFTTTSHIAVTLALGLLSISIVVIYGFYKNGFSFLKLFVPSGVPAWLLPLVSIIEIVSFLSRPISLAIRLFANMLAGHIILKVFAGFIISLLAAGAWGVLSIFPMLGIVAITMLEVLVAFLQAYVFAILTCIYLNDAVHAGHH